MAFEKLILFAVLLSRTMDTLVISKIVVHRGCVLPCAN